MLLRAPVAIAGAGKRVHLVEPIEYLPFVYLMDRCYLIVADSGGVQEEAPSFGKPVLVTRAVTERREAVRAGLAKLVGTECRTIVAEASRSLAEPVAYAGMTTPANPYGDGEAAKRIVDILYRGRNEEE